jgi:hypothetical protein
MKRGAKAEPGQVWGRVYGADFGIPSVRYGLAVQALCLAFTGAANSRAISRYLRCDKRKGISGDERVVGKSCGLPFVVDSQEILKAKGEPIGETRSCCGPCSRSEVVGERSDSKGASSFIRDYRVAGTAPTAVTSSVS